MVFLCGKTTAQKEDHKWLFGFNTISPYYDENGNLDTTWGMTVMDFNQDPPTLRYNIDMFPYITGSNSSVCDSSGKLMFYSNGMQIYSGLSRVIIEDTIAYGLNWEGRKIENSKGELVLIGSAFIQSALILPMPGKELIYNLFYLLYDKSSPNVGDFHTRYFYRAEIDMSPSSGPGKIFFKDKIIISDSLFVADSMATTGLTACRHANGRDWWLVLPAKYHNRFYTYLIDPIGVHFHGIQESGDRFDMGVGQVCFSPDGRKLAANSAYNFGNNGSKIIIFDFDRCAGKITNPRSQFIPAGYGVSNGVAFSPDSRYLYASNDNWIYQYDMYNPDIIGSRQTIATYDGYEYIYPQTVSGDAVTLGWLGLAPDGRIYVSSGSSSNRKMGVINYPNEKDGKYDMRQHSLHITTSYGRTMPNYPNYRLGPLDQSSCDTLSLNNNPIAKYRYEQDTSQYLKVRFTDLSYYVPQKWHWDFGDGSTSEERNSYHTFPADGSYEVCLTVSNKYDTNTVCRTLTFGTLVNTEPKQKEIEVNLFPNPVLDYLNVTLADYLPSHGLFNLYNSSGQKILSKPIFYGINNINMSDLVSGVYSYNITDNAVILKVGKLVKI